MLKKIQRTCLVMAIACGSAAALADDTRDMPGPTLADDLKTFTVKPLPDYEQQRPRLLFSSADREALRKKSADFPDLWKAVLDSANRVRAVPDGKSIAVGKTYWRIEGVQSAALAYFVTGDKKYLAATIPWMLAYCREPVWGTVYRPNLDLQASWYLYHLSLAYDILHDDLSEPDRAAIRTGLAHHAQVIFDDYTPAPNKEPLRYEQNHTYIPACALATAALALRGEVPEAADWLNRSAAIMRRARYALGDDGYYYEGFGYWTYALHWHVRYADLMARATGQPMFDLPVLAQGWKFGLYMGLPGTPGSFDVGDAGQWSGDKRPNIPVSNHAMMWDVADALKSGECKTAGDYYQARQPEKEYPAAAFLWATHVPPTPVEQIKPYNYFDDHDLLAWRSGWGDDATAYLFRCGPPEGHKAAAKLKQMTDWVMNAGHVHPDIGAFYIFAKGTFLATTTGYTAEKWTKDHNTLLIDGKGQGNDGQFWNDRGIPYDQFNSARIEQSYLSDGYAYATGVLGGAYAHQVKGIDLRRSVLMNKRWFLTIDDMTAPGDHTLTWLCHADAAFKPAGANFIASLSKASLAVLPLSDGDVEAKPEPTVVMAGMKPGPGTPTQRGYQLSFTTKQPAKSVRLVNLLVPLDPGSAAPGITDRRVDGSNVSFKLKWADEHTESVQLDLAWTSTGAGGAGPAKISE